jgi:hypothetical protein
MRRTYLLTVLGRLPCPIDWEESEVPAFPQLRGALR